MINKTKTDCENTLCYYDTIPRPRFFHGMLLTDEHLRAQQDYHREALKRVNRHLWGSGIICGLTIEKEGLCIKINPGVALDCCGNLIEVCKCITLDLSKECEKKYGSDCPPRQPQGTNTNFEFKKYLVLRYVERETDLEPVLTPDTDCESGGGKSKCSASKVQEGFCIELWDKCPCPEEDPSVVKDLITTLREAGEQRGMADQGGPIGFGFPGFTQPPADSVKDCIDLPLPCSGCGCCESAVGLAVLTINCEEKTVVRNTECDCRRYVMSPRLLNWLFSRVRSKSTTTEMDALASRVGGRSEANMMVSGMAFEAPKTAVGKSQGTDTLSNDVKKMKAEIAALKKKVANGSRKSGANPSARNQ